MPEPTASDTNRRTVAMRKATGAKAPTLNPGDQERACARGLGLPAELTSFIGQRREIAEGGPAAQLRTPQPLLRSAGDLTACRSPSSSPPLGHRYWRSIEEVAGRLTDRFRLLTAGDRTAPRRHQTLRATLDWSYELLSADEQLLFDREM